jgi:hypothetical protein
MKFMLASPEPTAECDLAAMGDGIPGRGRVGDGGRAARDGPPPAAPVCGWKTNTTASVASCTR